MQEQLALFKDAGAAAAASKKKKRVMFGDVSTFYSNTDVTDAPVKKVRGIKPLTRKGGPSSQEQENSEPVCSPEASSSLRHAPTPAPKLQSEESWYTAQSIQHEISSGAGMMTRSMKLQAEQQRQAPHFSATANLPPPTMAAAKKVGDNELSGILKKQRAKMEERVDFKQYTTTQGIVAAPAPELVLDHVTPPDLTTSSGPGLIKNKIANFQDYTMAHQQNQGVLNGSKVVKTQGSMKEPEPEMSKETSAAAAAKPPTVPSKGTKRTAQRLLFSISFEFSERFKRAIIQQIISQNTLYSMISIFNHKCGKNENRSPSGADQFCSCG